MRYTEPKDRSAELLRVALGHMGRHEAGINPGLHAAIERLLAEKAPVGDAVVARLYDEHVVPNDAAAVQRVGCARKQ